MSSELLGFLSKPIDFLASQPFDKFPGGSEIQSLVKFFKEKGTQKLKQEDREEIWYQDWLDYQKEHKIYAGILDPFEIPKLVNFVRAFGSFSPAHGYSFQVSFLGIFPFLRSKNREIRSLALEKLHDGGLFAFGVSEKSHGSDLYGNEFVCKSLGDGRFEVFGDKYYIGNANCASLIAVLARDESGGSISSDDKKSPFVFFALDPTAAGSKYQSEKIPTQGVKSAFVGKFHLDPCEISSREIISTGQDAWDSILGTVNIGKFLLGFAALGMAERAISEAQDHLEKRILYGKPVSSFPHIQALVKEAKTRWQGMNLYAMRAVDYIQVASADDRRYLLYTAVQKAKVSLEGVRITDMLMECVGAKGFEANTFLETAGRDMRLLPGLEGSTHVNFGIAVQMLKSFFFGKTTFSQAQSCWNKAHAGTNEYLFESPATGLKNVQFHSWATSFKCWKSCPEVRDFVGQARWFQAVVASMLLQPSIMKSGTVVMDMGKIFSTLVYGQLISEQAHIVGLPQEEVAEIFTLLTRDLSIEALKLRENPDVNRIVRGILNGMI